MPLNTRPVKVSALQLCPNRSSEMCALHVVIIAKLSLSTLSCTGTDLSYISEKHRPQKSVFLVKKFQEFDLKND